MGELNLDPIVGEKVKALGHYGLFEIATVHPPVRPGLGTVDLKLVSTGYSLSGVPWSTLQYVNETRPVRRVIEGLKTDSGAHPFPKYVVDYEVETGDDHAGTPAIFVRFFVDPRHIYENGRPSEDKVAALNSFLYEVQQKLLGLGLDRWTYVRAAEAAKEELNVAS